MRLTGGWIVLGLSAANLINYACRNALAPVHDALVARHGLSNQMLGILDAAFIFAHALATPVMGWLGDRLHRVRLLGWAVATAGCALAVGAVAPSPWAMLATRIIGGVATAAVVPVAVSILGELATTRGELDGRGKARMLATFSLGLLFGAVAAFGLGSALPYPWHLLVIGGLGVVVAAVLRTLDVPAFRASAPAATATAPAGLPAFFVALRAVGRGPALRRIVVSATLMAFGAGAYNKWLLQYLMHERGMSRLAAIELFGASIAVGVVGILVGGAIADRWRRARVAGRLHAMALSMALTVPCSYLALRGPEAIFVPACLLNMFFISWYHGPMAATIDDLSPPGMAALAQGVVIFVMHALGTSLGIYSVGLLADHYRLSTALMLPLAAVILASLAMTRATRRFVAHMQGAVT